jgi:RNA polymerase sigma-70 factor (ECF subfamily)
MAELTEDIVQEVFLKVWEKRDQLNIQVSLKSYIFRVCHNYIVDMTRKIETDRKLKDQLLYRYQQYLEENGPSPQEMERLETLLEEGLDTLSSQRRKVYELCKRQGLTYQQAAEQLGITANTVKEHMVKTLSILRQYIKDKGELALLLLFYILYP